MARLTKEQIASAHFTLQEEEVEVPELGGSVLVRQLTAGARTRLVEGLFDPDTGNLNDLPRFQARMFATSVVDPQFTEDEAIGMLEQWPAPTWDHVMNAIGNITPNPQEVERAAAREFRSPDERPEVPVLTGAGAGHDGSEA